jgi:hypothetical protein
MNKKHVDDPCGAIDMKKGRGELIPETHCSIH